MNAVCKMTTIGVIQGEMFVVKRIVFTGCGILLAILCTSASAEVVSAADAG